MFFFFNLNRPYETLFSGSLFTWKQPSCLPLIDLASSSSYWLLLVRNWFTHVSCSFSAKQHRLNQLTRPRSAACRDVSSCVKSWRDRHWSWRQFGQRKQRQKPPEKQRLVNKTSYLSLWWQEKLVFANFLSFIVISAFHHMLKPCIIHSICSMLSAKASRG